MTSYLALLVLLAALTVLVATLAIRPAPARAMLFATATGALAAAAMALARLPEASLNLPLGPGAQVLASLTAASGSGLVVAFGPDAALFILLALLGGACALAIAPARARAVAGLCVLTTLAMLVVDRLHVAGMLGLLCLALLWDGRRHARPVAGRPGGVWPGRGWPVVAVLAPLALCAGVSRPDAPGAGLVPAGLPGTLALGGVALSVALARAGVAAGTVADRAGPWSGVFGTLASLALAWRAVRWTAAGPDVLSGLSYANPLSVAFRHAGSIEGALMALAGLAIALAAVWRGLGSASLRGALAEIALAQLGLVWLAAGLGALASGATLPGVAAAARAACWLLAVQSGLMRIGGACLVETIAARAGDDRFDRLGGLARLMPRQSLWLAGLLGQLLLVPPLAGFAAGWALLQALFASPPIGDLLTGCALLAATLLAALALAGLAATALRIATLALLGRPRTPRTAGAEDPRGAASWLPALPLAGLTVCGLLPGWAQFPAALHLALPAAGPMGGLIAASGAAYAPLVPALVFAALAGAGWRVWRRLVPHGAPAAAGWWEDGAAPPPPWLPFGDPERQPGRAFLRPARAGGPVGPKLAPHRLLRRMRRRGRQAAGALAGDTLPELWPAALLALACVLLLAVAL